jgi:vacuolar-type H+-ATPase subunit H
MNAKNIQQVLDIEKQAQEIHEAAVKEAQQLPVLAEQEAQALIEKAKAEAHKTAQEMVSKVQGDEDSGRILSEAEEKSRQLEDLAKKNFDRAVAYVLERVAGRG